MQGTLFGFTEAQISDFALTYGVAGLMLLMMFIVGRLAWECKAGKFGTMVLFIGLALGMVGYVAKYIIKYQFGI